MRELPPRMIGMILVTHGRLAEEFVHAMEHVVGQQDDVATVCIGPQRRHGSAGARRSPRRSSRSISGSGAVILTDLFGGTPSNLAISLLKAGKTEVIAGINLPMLIRLAGARKDMDLAAAAAAARDAGRNYITIASEFLGQDA